MPRNRDLFDDSTMSFGEHLEALRVHVWKALLGMIVGVILSLTFGNQLIGFLRKPIDKALTDANMTDVQDDVGNVDMWEFLTKWWNDELDEEEPPPEDPEFAGNELLVEVPLSYAKQMVEKVAPGTIAQPPEVDSADAESDNTTDAEEPNIRLLIKSDEIAMWRSAAERFNRPVTLKVEEAFMTYIKVSLVAGIAIASPWIFYQIWMFVAAGLFSHERKYVYMYLPMSLGLFLAGAAFCFYLVMPIVLEFLISFNKWLGVSLQPRLSEYISFVLMLPVLFGVSFQLPLVMLFLERIGIMTVEGYSKNWRMAVLVIAVLSMLLTPSDPSSMMLMMFPLVFLYMGGIQLCKLRPGAKADPLA